MKRLRSGYAFLLFCLIQMAGATQAVADETILVSAQNLLNQGQALEALELLQPLEEELAGDQEYDYLYGLALIDTGEPASAVFAFQRILAIDPNFAGARLELARAYFEMDQMQRSLREFNILQSQAPPPQVAEVIDKYLAAIESRSLRNRRGWRGFLEFAMGQDSNATTGTTAQTVTVGDGLFVLPLSENSREKESSVVSILAGAGYDLPLGYNSKLFFKASVAQRSNHDVPENNTFNQDLVTGYTHNLKSGSEFSTALQLFNAEVDGHQNNRGYNLSAQFNMHLSPRDQVGFLGRVGAVDYADANNIRDIELGSLVGLSWAHVFGRTTRLSTVLAALGGEDETDDATSPWGREYSGLRLSLAYPVTHRLNLFVSMARVESDYNGSVTDGLFNVNSPHRSDTQDDVSIGASWRANKSWVLRLLISHTDNFSNEEIFDYERTQVMLTARSEFLP